MRIIAGQWRGRKLIAPAGDATRPTADRVREALFSMLASRLGSFDGLRVADIFAGSGALGLEALSRGAAHCTFVEEDRAALKALDANIAVLGAEADVLRRSALNLPAAEAPFDLVLLDPPYASADGLASLELLREREWIGLATLVSFESGDEDKFSDVFCVEVQRQVARARISLLRLAG